MAKLIPSLNSCLRRMTAGEKRVARILESHLEDDYLCWYEPRVGTGQRSRYTDFIVLHPSRGLLLLEVKDWKLSSLHSVDPQFFKLLTNNGLKSVQHPLDQARQCTYSLINSLCRDPALTHQDGHHKGKLICPYAFGVVLTGITRKEFDSSDMGMVLPEHLVICRDEIDGNGDAEVFQKRLWDMFPRQFSEPLSLPQIDRIRWHLFPEIRISPPEQLLIGSDQTEQPDQKSKNGQDCQEGPYSTVADIPFTNAATNKDDPDQLFPDIIKVMDLEQEALARSLGDGHRVIHGVAGSGKTLILGYRCVHLANTFIKPVLVLCFNVALAARLREVIQINELSERVQVRHFHDWCGDQLRTYHVDKPAAGSHYVHELVQTVIDATESGRIPRAQYGAVMIDEGHDFEPDWLRLIVSMIDPDTNSLLLLYDDAQSIYTKRSLGFSLSSVGVQAVGRTKILRVNYRNTDEIINYAYQFASTWLSGEELDDDHVTTVTLETAGRHGPKPVFKLCPGYEEEVQLIIKCIREQHDKGIPWSDICVAYRANWMGEKLNEAMKSAKLPVHWLRSKADKTRLSSSDPSIKLMTMHSSKGLEFPLVIVSGVGSMPDKHAEAATEAKLLYVAMTRATEKLLVTAHHRSEFAEKLAA